jgi:hypothetical protein
MKIADTIMAITTMAITIINRAIAVLVIALLLAPGLGVHAADSAPSAETSSNPWRAFGSAVKRDATLAGTAIKSGAHRVALASKSAAHEVASGFKRAVDKTRTSLRGQPGNGSASS